MYSRICWKFNVKLIQMLFLIGWYCWFAFWFFLCLLCSSLFGLMNLHSLALQRLEPPKSKFPFSDCGDAKIAFLVWCWMRLHSSDRYMFQLLVAPLCVCVLFLNRTQNSLLYNQPGRDRWLNTRKDRQIDSQADWQWQVDSTDGYIGLSMCHGRPLLMVYFPTSLRMAVLPLFLLIFMSCHWGIPWDDQGPKISHQSSRSGAKAAPHTVLDLRSRGQGSSRVMLPETKALVKIG